MKRSPLTRKKALQRTSMKAARTFEPPPDVYEAVKRRAGGKCEYGIVGICRGRPTDIHHRNTDRRLNTLENLVFICGPGGAGGCHGAAHTHPQRYEHGWLVHSWDDPALVDFDRGVLPALPSHPLDKE